MKKNSGFTLIEVLVAAVAIAFLTVSSMGFFAALNTHIKVALDKYRAINLCISQLEDLKQVARKNFNRPELADTQGVDPHDATITLPDGFDVAYAVEDKYDWVEDGINPDPIPSQEDHRVDYKKVSVNCTYGAGRQVDFVTYIIDK